MGRWGWGDVPHGILQDEWYREARRPRRRPPVDTHTHARACTRAPSPKRGEVGGLQADGAVNTVGSRAGSRFQPQKGVEEEVWGEEGGGHICLQTKSRKPTGNGRFPADEAESSPTTTVGQRTPEAGDPGQRRPPQGGAHGKTPASDTRKYPKGKDRKRPSLREGGVTSCGLWWRSQGFKLR